MVYGLLIILLIAAIFKIITLKKTARVLANDFADRLKTDTNTLIDIPSRDKDMRFLADSINKQLTVLRKEHLQYYQGNTELKNAVTNISHDLRTPLTAIAGNLYMIKKTEDIAEIREYIASIEDRTEAMKLLTEELFRYSVIVSEENETAKEDVYVNQILQESISSFYPVLSQNNITPKIDITDVSIIRKGSKTDLARIFSNLLNNAVKYSDGDLEIVLSSKGEITFSNEAKGLTQVQVEQLFDRFYTVESARNSTGLGLSIARTLVERMGGSITADYTHNRLTIKVDLGSGGSGSFLC